MLKRLSLVFFAAIMLVVVFAGTALAQGPGDYPTAISIRAGGREALVGEAISFTATVTSFGIPVPDGTTVTFTTSDGRHGAFTIADGQATISVNGTNPGALTVTATAGVTQTVLVTVGENDTVWDMLSRTFGRPPTGAKIAGFVAANAIPMYDPDGSGPRAPYPLVKKGDVYGVEVGPVSATATVNFYPADNVVAVQATTDRPAYAVGEAINLTVSATRRNGSIAASEAVKISGVYTATATTDGNGQVTFNFTADTAGRHRAYIQVGILSNNTYIFHPWTPTDGRGGSVWAHWVAANGHLPANYPDNLDYLMLVNAYPQNRPGDLINVSTGTAKAEPVIVVLGPNQVLVAPGDTPWSIFKAQTCPKPWAEWQGELYLTNEIGMHDPDGDGPRAPYPLIHTGDILTLPAETC